MKQKHKHKVAVPQNYWKVTTDFPRKSGQFFFMLKVIFCNLFLHPTIFLVIYLVADLIKRAGVHKGKPFHCALISTAVRTCRLL